MSSSAFASTSFATARSSRAKQSSPPTSTLRRSMATMTFHPEHRSSSVRTRASSASTSPTSADAIERAKNELLAAIEGTERGILASDEEKRKIDDLARALEALNPNPKSLSASCINGEWELVYTTSASILGTNKPSFLRPSGKIYQTIDADALRARNRETFPFYNAVEAELTPTSDSAVKVQFKKFYVLNGLIKVTAPDRARGALDITFVDDTVRVSRGDKGNLFILVMHDKLKRLS
ncbi:hypothetical protein BE221DRAFT_188172 [Ostreococcus tauri]|uniref:Plastid lipid-associated protein/fibrillin conserved domain-containing protein n=1 Tax=Ostreococcus tauri TaxID=70448 RepID=A0A1Y5HYH2_OSTTA|nr:hypothetical protein BE221DRAFT_188172 [Ostreococcus tauri]